MKRADILAGPATIVAITSAVAFASASSAQGVKRYEEVPASAYSVVAEVRAKPGREDALRAATLPLVAQVRADPKNLVYFLQEDRDAKGHFIFYEVFATRQDFEAHNAMPYVKAWFDQLPSLADGGVKVMRMEVLPAAAASAPRP